MPRTAKRLLAVLILMCILAVARYVSLAGQSWVVMAGQSFGMWEFTAGEMIAAGFTPYPDQMIALESQSQSAEPTYALPMEKDGIRLSVYVNLDPSGAVRESRIREFVWFIKESPSTAIRIGAYTLHSGMKAGEAELPINWRVLESAADGTIEQILCRVNLPPPFVSGWYANAIFPLGLLAFFLALDFLGMKKLSNAKQFFKDEMETLYRRLGKPWPSFRPDRQVMKTIKESKGVSASELSIRLIFDPIVAHFRLDPGSLTLFFLHSSLDSVEAGFGRAGQYQQTSVGAGEIELTVRRDFNPWNIAAILAHECAHHWLVVNGLSNCSPTDLEYRTDIATLYAGFGKVMRKGYAEKEKSLGLFSGLVVRFRIGYLNQRDFDYVLSLISHYRRKNKAQSN